MLRWIGIFALLVGVLCAVPAQAKFLDDVQTTVDTLPTRTLGGLTFVGGFKDPGEGLMVNLNSIVRLPGLVMTWKQHRVLELGMLSLGGSGPAGDDSRPGSGAKFILGGGGCLLEWACANAVWLVDRDARNNFGVFGGAQVDKLGLKLWDMIKQRTGL